ncbi:MAG: acylphosphatase [Acidimicrobiia bacterium]
MTERAITAVVSGRVQGVFFRASARRVAQALGVSGWVRNRPDGTVEAFAQGDPESLDEFVAWLEQGPTDAHVTDVEVADAEVVPRLVGFDVRR